MTGMEIYPMIEKLQQLAQLRAKAEAATTAKQDAEASAKATPQWEAYQAAADAAKIIEGAISELIATIKQDAVATYRETREKKVFPGVNIKVFKKFTVAYDPQKAKQWAISNMTTALKLDSSKFEEAASAGDVPSELASVVKWDEPQAQIDSDLSRYLVKAQELPSDFIPRFIGDSPDLEAAHQ